VYMYSSDQITCYLRSLALKHGGVALWPTSERPGSVIPLSRTFTLFGVHSWIQSLWKFLKRIANFRWCMCSVRPLTSLPLHPRTNNLQVIWSLLYWHRQTVATTSSSYTVSCCIRAVNGSNDHSSDRYLRISCFVSWLLSAHQHRLLQAASLLPRLPCA
jgi:hypothetical protein